MNYTLSFYESQVWRRYEMKHKPAFIVDIRLPQRYLDVNLTPDKREVAILNESFILDKLREAVDTLYAPSRFTLPVNVSGRIAQHFSPATCASNSEKKEQEDSIKSSFTHREPQSADGSNSSSMSELYTPPSQSEVAEIEHSIEPSSIFTVPLNGPIKSNKRKIPWSFDGSAALQNYRNSWNGKGKIFLLLSIEQISY